MTKNTDLKNNIKAKLKHKQKISRDYLQKEIKDQTSSYC